MELGTVLSINVGNLQKMLHGSKEIITGINKSAVGKFPISLSRLGLEGDAQGDLVYHGGEDKAVCVYSADHFPFWSGRWQRAVEAGAFGENFTVTQLTEGDLCIGDILSVGEAIVQVSQPRQPCYKLGMKHGLPQLAQEVQETGYTGFYLRVLKEGIVQAGDKLILQERHPAGITVTEANRVMHMDKNDLAGIRSLLAVQELAVSWQQSLSKRGEALRTNG
ncbi:MOSC domain-containing protein [Paenibacillus sp. OV219]|uniref:MOSC domain-containing protein n=1 Tax=Paenibacillus sp. OV219 TaxID=1884377 RepID=UPI0008BB9C3E|nr:MOSC domain-containing protein [Paenibacillus sp. OV219]SEM85685.1 MOSC domain-containing protein YiiM [Paenibacillus sp. OV219]